MREVRGVLPPPAWPLPAGTGSTSRRCLLPARIPLVAASPAPASDALEPAARGCLCRPRGELSGGLLCLPCPPRATPLPARATALGGQRAEDQKGRESKTQLRPGNIRPITS